MLFVDSFRKFFSPSNKESNREVPPKEMFSFFDTALTLQGEDHKLNEDRLICDHEHQLYAVFDGISGASGDNGGHFASETARSVFEKRFASVPLQLSENEAVAKIRDIVQEAHAEVSKIKIGDQKNSPGTTATALKFFRDPKTENFYGLIANVGDSRAYQMTGGRLRRLTFDHNLDYMNQISAQLKNNKKGYVPNVIPIPPESNGVYDSLDDWSGVGYTTPDGTDIQERSHRRNVVTSFIGVQNERPHFIDVMSIREIFPDDCFLVMSDGVHDNLTTSEIEKIIVDSETVEAIVRNLTNAALQRSREKSNYRAKKDDMTVVCVKVSDLSKTSLKEKDVSGSQFRSAA